MIRKPVETMSAPSKKAVGKPLTIILSPEFRALIDEQAQRELRTASEIVREALRRYYGIGQEPSAAPMSGARHHPQKV